MPPLNPFANSSPPSPTLLPITPTSSSSSSSRKPNHARARSAPALSLDLSAIRGFGTPFSYNASPPTNTLLLTALDDLRLFQPSTLDAMKQALSELAPLNSFSPLPSFRRIVVSFREVDEAVKARTYLEIKGLRTKPKATGPDEKPAAPSSMLKETGAIFPRIYFGEFTPIVSEDNSKSFLDLPPANKLFFISPPPSPPAGWQMKTEDPPNKEVVATDLAAALHKLGGGSNEDEPEQQQQTDLTPTSSSSSIAVDANAGPGTWGDGKGRKQGHGRSMSSTLIYHPEHHGSDADLPAVMVEDTSMLATGPEEDGQEQGLEVGAGGAGKKMKTARPPVELME